MTVALFLKDEAATLAFGRQFSQALVSPLMVYLEGELGAGKTTFVRGVLRGLGFEGRVKSPTYTLLEQYPLHEMEICHVDLYRLKTPEELNDLGLRDYFDSSVFLVEWPERADAYLVPADIRIEFALEKEGRRLTLTANSQVGESLLQSLQIKV